MTSFPQGPYSVHPYTKIQGLHAHTRDDGKQWHSAAITIGAGKKMLGEVRLSTSGEGYPTITNGDEMRALAALWIAAPDMFSAASKLIAAFDELQATTTAERIITARSDRDLRKETLEAVAELRSAIAKAIPCPCDGAGRIYNNADTTSGQFIECGCSALSLEEAA